MGLIVAFSVAPVSVMLVAARVVTLGALCTVNVVERAVEGARFPAVSLAVALAIEMPMVPKPVMLEIVTVLVVPLPVTPINPVAVPVLWRAMSPTDRVEALK